MRFGIHVSVSGGLKQSALRAAAMGCETMQIFSGNPMGWKIVPLDPKSADGFRCVVKQEDIRPVFLHTPYLVNLASPDGEILHRSRESVLAAMRRAEMLGAAYVVTHIGSHKGAGLESGLARVVESLDIVHQSIDGRVTILLENTPGSGNSIGHSFEEFNQILDALPHHSDRLGVCLDTAHLWGAGFDIATAEGLQRTLESFAGRVGMERLNLIHANDSSVGLGSHRDIHQPPGKGKMGVGAFAALANHPWLAEMPVILELPTEGIEAVAAELKQMRSLRGLRVEGGGGPQPSTLKEGMTLD